jgi:hypothetical protein
MATLPIPIDRYLVPEAPRAVPEHFTRLRLSLTAGLPATFPLDAELRVAVFAATGDARLWQVTRADELVALASDDDAPSPPNIRDDPAERPVLRLVLLRGSQIVAAVPLVPRLVRRLPDSSERGALIDLVVIDYRIAAGTLRQAGDFGSFLELAWARIDRGTSSFALPSLPPRIAERFSGVLESQLGAAEDGGLSP